MTKVLVARLGEGASLQQMPNELNELVAGSVQCVQLEHNYILYCNHEGNVLDLPANPYFARGIVKGNFVISKTDQNGNNLGLDADDYAFVMKTYIQNQHVNVK